MSDLRSRELERRIAAGEVEDQGGAWMANRIRTWSPLLIPCRGCMARRGGGHRKGCTGIVAMPDTERLALAAYCGHAGAREHCDPVWVRDQLVFGVDRVRVAHHSKRDWTKGLGRWSGAVDLSAVAASETVLAALDPLCDQYLLCAPIVHATRAQIEEPTKERRSACMTAWNSVDPSRRGPAWLTPHHPAEAIRACVRFLGEGGETAVRSAVCAELVRWVLA